MVFIVKRYDRNKAFKNHKQHYILFSQEIEDSFVLFFLMGRIPEFRRKRITHRKCRQVSLGSP